MHEDLLQAIFLQYLGVKWSVAWNGALATFQRTKGVWKSPQASLSLFDRKRREYFLGPQAQGSSVASRERWLYRNQFFVYQLCNTEQQSFAGDQGAQEADFEGVQTSQQNYQQQLLQLQVQNRQRQQQTQPMQMQAMQVQQPSRGVKTALRSTGGKAPRMQLASKAARSTVPYGITDAEEDEDDDEDIKNPMEAKQRLLHLLSTRILMDSRLHGEITCFRSQINALYSSLPHITILSVLQYLGVSTRWVKFFQRFLEAPLQFIDDQSSAPRKRRRGTPGSHILSEVFSEVVMFCLDFQVNAATKGNLWRMGDDFWFWSREHDAAVTAWRTTTNFADTIGLSLNDKRTGSVRIQRDENVASKLKSIDTGSELPRGDIRWGMLRLNPETGSFEIDQELVDKHIDEMSRYVRS